MCENFWDIGRRGGKPTSLTKAEYREALRGLDLASSDTEILDRRAPRVVCFFATFRRFLLLLLSAAERRRSSLVVLEKGALAGLSLLLLLLLEQVREEEEEEEEEEEKGSAPFLVRLSSGHLRPLFFLRTRSTLWRCAFQKKKKRPTFLEKKTPRRLFVMLDRTGEERVNHVELLVGLTPLISATTSAKIEFALEIFDNEDSGRITRRGCDDDTS